MKKHPIFLLAVLVLCSAVFSQEQKVENRSSVTLCWVSDLDTSARYIVYFNRHKSADTSWYALGTTKEKSFTVLKQSFKGDIAFGVKSVYSGDTSAMHKSIDTDACTNPNTTCDPNCTNGGWYINWHIGKAKGLQIQ